MSLAQFPSFPRPTPTLPRSSPPISSPSQQMTPATSASAPHPPRACCENGRPILTDPHTGQTVCSCQYPGGLPLSYPRNPAAALPPGLESVYNASAYAAAGYVALGSEGSAFYSPLGSGPFDLKESAEAWRTLAATQPGFPYDPMAVYPYGPGKNATRENTNTLKAWLYEHRKNPYPTKGEKIMLAIITKMTLTQVSTWFANARRRLKKENKMTWSPRNRSEDGSDDIDNPDDDDDCADGRNRSVVMSPSDQHELDITSSKPSSPILSTDSNHIGLNNNRPFKERIIRVDEDDDDDDDCDDDDVHDHDDDDDDTMTRLNNFRFRHLEELQRRGDNAKSTSLLSRDSDQERDRDRSPLRSFSDSDATDDVLSRVRAVTSATGVSELGRPCRTSSPNKDTSEDGGATSPKSTSASSPRPPSHINSPSDKSCPSSPSQSRSQQSSSFTSSISSKQQQTPPTTRPKIWSISDVISTTSSSSSSSSSSSLSSLTSLSSNSSISTNSSLSSSSTLLPSSLILSPSSSTSSTTVPSLSSLSSPLSLNRHHPFLPHSPSSSSAPRPIPNPGFLFLPHGPAHWQAAAARFAGMGGAYPLTLAHSTLSYPYNLATPNAVRAGLEAHAQSVAQLARATAEGNAAAASIAAAAVAASRGIESRDGDKITLAGLSRHPNGGLISTGRDIDAVRAHGMGPPRLVVDTSLQ